MSQIAKIPTPMTNIESFASRLLQQYEKIEATLKIIQSRQLSMERSMRVLTNRVQEQKILFMRGMHACHDGYKQTREAVEHNIESCDDICQSMACATVTQWC